MPTSERKLKSNARLLLSNWMGWGRIEYKSL